MTKILAAEKEERLQLFRQLYDRCREQHGEDYEQTRMLLELISQVEEQPSPTHRQTRRKL
jgi:hypothetical protein